MAEFLPTDLIFELRMVLDQLRLTSGTTPDDDSALIYGALDGLSVGRSLLAANYFSYYGSDFLEVIGGFEKDKALSVEQVVVDLNKLLTRDVLTKNNFRFISKWGLAPTGKHYRHGFEIAMAWASKLYYSAISYSVERERAKFLAKRHIDDMHEVLKARL